ncbi:hypothetical protein GCM10010244_57660 [Streptomyces coeruleorubidus]|nr:hypothetical protein GCM10010244_57660 [Streptomyces bellus]
MAAAEPVESWISLQGTRSRAVSGVFLATPDGASGRCGRLLLGCSVEALRMA